MSDPKTTDVSTPQEQEQPAFDSAAFLRNFVVLVGLVADGQALRNVRAAYLAGTDEGNRAVFALITGFEDAPHPVLDKVLIPWLREQLVFKPARGHRDPEIVAAGETLHSAFAEASAEEERAHLCLVKR